MTKVMIISMYHYQYKLRIGVKLIVKSFMIGYNKCYKEYKKYNVLYKCFLRWYIWLSMQA